MDQRVISTSAFQCVGNVLKLHGRVYSPPYVVRAIGDPDDLREALDASPAVQLYLRDAAEVGLGWSVTDARPAARARRVLGRHRAAVRDGPRRRRDPARAGGGRGGRARQHRPTATPGPRTAVSATTTEPAPLTRRERRTASHARDVTYGVVGVIGELLITARRPAVRVPASGSCGGRTSSATGRRPRSWPSCRSSRVPTATPSAGAPAGPVIAPPRRDEPPVMAEPPHATTFATIQVPRWAGEPERPISQGTDRATVLDVLGVGHYEGTAMPGGRRQLRGRRPPDHVRQAVQPGRGAAGRRPAGHPDDRQHLVRLPGDVDARSSTPSDVERHRAGPRRPRRGADGAHHHADHLPPDVLRAGAVHRARRPGLLGADVGRDPGRAGRWRMMVTCTRDGGR